MQELERAHAPRDVDLGAAGRGVWLVKVPKYLSQRWKKSTGSNPEVGKLKITRPKFPDQKPSVVFTLNEQLTKTAPGEMACPKEHKMVLTGLGNQNLCVFSQLPTEGEPTGGELANEKIAVEGKVIQRAECRPVTNDSSYLKLKREQLEASMKPQREVKQISTVVTSYKPVSKHVFHVENEGKQKNEKRLRDDKDKVQDMLFNAFEKHQYYNVKDLVRITKQPITYLKEVLKEICVYNMKAPHRNMWELKPEYRHYKDTDQGSSGT